MRILLAALAMILTLGQAQAQDLAEPTGEVVLTITGNLTQSGAEDGARFDMDMLKALPARTFATSTIWTEGEQTFVGVHLSALLDHVGAAQVTIHATAINDYAVDIPHDDWQKDLRARSDLEKIWTGCSHSFHLIRLHEYTDLPVSSLLMDVVAQCILN